jgi:hypothetical protein
VIVDGLVIPLRLVELAESRRWPSDVEESLTGEAVQSVFPDERYVHLESPPFTTIAADIGRFGSTFWGDAMGAPDEIDSSKAVIIGDFGRGSDAPIVLDYRENDLVPFVRRLKWNFVAPRMTDNHWVLVASSFDEFAELLGL